MKDNKKKASPDGEAFVNLDNYQNNKNSYKQRCSSTFLTGYFFS